jgi:hypothetical protein
MCKPIELYNSYNVQINQCISCKEINLWRKEALLKFSIEQFDIFAAAIKKINFSEFSEWSPCDEEILILATPAPDISLVFSQKDWTRFTEAINQARYMQKVYELIHY